MSKRERAYIPEPPLDHATSSPMEDNAMNHGKYKTDLLQRLDSFDIRLDPDHKDQHLIVNPEAIDALISFADITPADTVLEIGSGPGNITERLAKRAGHVYAVEIDKRFRPILQSLAKKYPNITVIMGDFLDLDLPEFDKIVANPPFSILEPMIQKFGREKFESATLIIGEKYYQRVIAKPGTDNFTKTSLFTQAHFTPSLLKRLEISDFFPESREKAVIMKLDSVGHKPNIILPIIAYAFSESAEKRTSSLVSSICHEFGMPKGGKITARNYDQAVTPESLGLPRDMLAMRLQELSNKEISRLVGKLVNICKKPSPKRHEEEDDEDYEDEE